MTVAEPSAGGRAELAHRLVELRQRRWDKVVPQRVLAEALGSGSKPLAQSLISGWEKGTVVPPARRLREIATFFSTQRSVAGGRARLLQDHELTPAEKETRDELYEELTALRDGAGERIEAAPDAPVRFDWAFPGSLAVRIVCGALENMSHPYTEPNSWNYTDLLTFADLDALMELFGHVRKVNPDTDVRFIRSDRLERVDQTDELTNHLVLLGGIGLNTLTDRMLTESGMPIRQIEHTDFADTGEIFEVTEGPEKNEFLPKVEGDRLLEDVALIARMPNPFNSSTTVTICNGVFARGVYGAVRALTDDQLRRQNEAWLTERFSGAARFAILVRVPVVLDKALTPDLTTEAMRLYEWCDQR